MEHLLTGKHCLIVGSSDEARIPHDFRGVIVAANGGVGVVIAAGYQVDVLCTTSYLCRPFPSEYEFKSIRTWNNQIFPCAWIDTTDGSYSQFLFRKDDYNFSTIRDVQVSKERRSLIVSSVCGQELGWNPDPYKRISTGCFAVALALDSGATEVTITGISTESRHHINADIDFLRLITQHPRKITTTSNILSNVTGLRRAA